MDNINKTAQHASLADGAWFALSYAEQMGNIGSEVRRALVWRGRDQKIFHRAIDRALELIDLTIQDPRWRARLKEISQAREILRNAALETGKDTILLEDLDQYFLAFAIAARIRKS